MINSFKICPNTFFQGGENVSEGALPPMRPPGYGSEGNQSKFLEDLKVKADDEWLTHRMTSSWWISSQHYFSIVHRLFL